MNDPCGLLQFEGTYHLCYQHNPSEARWGDIHWGHAASDDLLTWADRPIALEPEAGIDGDGCFTGCAVVDDGTPALLYTGVEDDVQRQCLATSDDPDLDRWEKEGVVIGDRPAGVDGTEIRDPYVYRVASRGSQAREDDRWTMLLGARMDGEGAVVLRYHATDLREWTCDGVFHAEPDRESVLECPGLVQFDERDVLWYSTMDDRSTVAVVGDASGEQFTVDHRTTLDHGDYYAPQALDDETGRPLLWGWLTEARSEDAQLDAGWSGAMSLPRALSIEDGRLFQRPAEEIDALRENEQRHSLDDGVTVLDREGRHLELTAAVPSDTGLELDVLRSPDGEEATTIRLDRGADEVVVDRSDASTAGVGADDPQRGPLPDGATTLRVFVDGSVVETYVDGRTCLSSRVYPSRPRSRGVAVRSPAGSDITLRTYEMESIWA